MFLRNGVDWVFGYYFCGFCSYEFSCYIVKCNTKMLEWCKMKTTENKSCAKIEISNSIRKFHMSRTGINYTGTSNCAILLGTLQKMTVKWNELKYNRSIQRELHCILTHASTPQWFQIVVCFERLVHNALLLVLYSMTEIYETKHSCSNFVILVPMKIFYVFRVAVIQFDDMLGQFFCCFVFVRDDICLKNEIEIIQRHIGYTVQTTIQNIKIKYQTFSLLGSCISYSFGLAPYTIITKPYLAGVENFSVM